CGNDSTVRKSVPGANSSIRPLFKRPWLRPGFQPNLMHHLRLGDHTMKRAAKFQVKTSPLSGSILVAVLLASTYPANGQTFTWQPTTGGLFDTGANWSPAGGPPSAGNTAIFNSTASQTVIFQTNVTLASHQIENGAITFQLNQSTNTMSGVGL